MFPDGLFEGCRQGCNLFTCFEFFLFWSPVCLHLFWLTNSCLKSLWFIYRLLFLSFISFPYYPKGRRPEKPGAREQQREKDGVDALCLLLYGSGCGPAGPEDPMLQVWWGELYSPTLLFASLLFNTSLFQTFTRSPQFLPTSSLFRLYLLAFSTTLAPFLPVPCQCDPCLVLQQRLAEAAETGNIYRSVRWGWALLVLQTHSSSSITVTTAATHRKGHSCTHIYRHFSHCISTYNHVDLLICSYSTIVNNIQTHLNLCTQVQVKLLKKVTLQPSTIDVNCCC